MISPEMQVNYVMNHKQEMEELIAYNANAFEIHKKEVANMLRQDPHGDHTKLKSMLQTHKQYLNFFEHVKNLNVKAAKQIHKKLCKQDNKLMNQQLFSNDQIQAMMIYNVDGTCETAHGTSECARLLGDAMKEYSDARNACIQTAAWLRNNCSLGVLMSA